MRLQFPPFWTGIALAAVLGAAAARPSWGQSASAKGKLSRNFYRVPYGNGLVATMTHDYVDHGNSPAGNFGPMDMGSSSPLPTIVAAADGVVLSVNDSRNGCGCHSAYGPCANSIRNSLHAHGEVSIYLHIMQGSAFVAPNQAVTQGQLIAFEGDVGFTCGGGSDPRMGTCVPVVPPGTGTCGRHLHWEVRRETTDEFVNPMTCGIVTNIYLNSLSYLAASCTTSQCGPVQTLSGVSWSGFGSFGVAQATDRITASTVRTSNKAALVFHAGREVRLTPGFRAAADSYFRAEIGSCNTTAAAP